jgi:hypothetical protein
MYESFMMRLGILEGTVGEHVFTVRLFIDFLNLNSKYNKAHFQLIRKSENQENPQSVNQPKPAPTPKNLKPK